MRLAAYYISHTFLNQLKKLFKTWVLVFIVICVVFGGAIGLIAGTVANHIEDTRQEEVVDEITEDEEGDSIEIELKTPFLEQFGMVPADMVELVAGAVILLMFVFMAIGADKSGASIFLPADVNLLFPSPMKPQSVLMFRLVTQLGSILIGSIYMLFQLPNLVLNAGLSLAAGIAIIFAWFLTVVFGTLLQLLLYALSSTYSTVKRYLRPIIFGVVGIAGAGFALYWKLGDVSLLTAANRYFNSGIARAIPVFGWLKGFCRWAVLGDPVMMLVYLGLLLVGAVVLVYYIWHIKVDFYEDAMAKSEETAELLAKARSEKSSGIVVARKKDRSDRIKRDGFSKGLGANVFFHKTMYNRFRFGHFGFLTKTMETYLVTAIFVAALCRFAFDVKSELPIVLPLAVMVFFRSLGNPLQQDTKMDYFRMIPENTWAKLFWSLMGGTVGCLLDLFLPMLLGAVIMGMNPLKVLIWLPVILSVDFFATTVGVFMDLSIPASIGATVKTLMQVLFIYFGILPDVGILVVGFLTGYLGLAVLGAVIFNLALGGLFFGLSPLFLE